MNSSSSKRSSLSNPSSASVITRRPSVPQPQQAGPARPVANRQDSFNNTVNGAQAGPRAPLKRQDTVGSSTARPALRRGSTNSQNTARGAQPGVEGPTSALRRQKSGLGGAKQASGAPSSVSVEDQIFDLKKTGSIGIISAMCGDMVTVVSYNGSKRAQIPAKHLLAGSKLQIGLEICKGLDAHSKTRIFTLVVPSEEYEGIIVAHASTFTGEIGVVTVRPPSPGQPFSLSSDSCEGGIKFDIGVHVYQRTVSCKYFTRAIGPE